MTIESMKKGKVSTFPLHISYICVSWQLRISFCDEHSVSHNALSYESPAEYQPSHSFA